MVSMNPFSPSLSYMKQVSNMPYPATSAWYQNYPPHHVPHHSNSQFLNGTSGIGGPAGMLDSDAAASFYNHHMLNHSHQPSPDYEYGIPTPNSMFPNPMSSASSLHISPSHSSQHNGSGNNNSSNGINDNLSNALQNVPPSPPITVSGCSEMSSPGIGSNGMGGTIGNGESSPNLSNSNDLSRPKTPFDWMKKPNYQSQPNPGKTRTKDKYRVVYTDFQRLELEKEYHMSHYITIRRKSELAQSLQLSERQVKIWFQNRRAKDRKQTKKRDGPVNGNGSILSNGCGNVGLSLQHHHNMSGGGSMNYLNDIKPKLEPGLLQNHHSHNYNLHHHHTHASHPMHQLSSMSMSLLHPSHMHHTSTAAALPPPISSPATSSATILQAHTIQS